MAAIPAARISKVFDSGARAERVCFYIVKNVDTADVVDLSAEFAEIKVGTFVAAGVLATIGTVGTTVGAATLTLATMADDTIFLTVLGNPA